jgi:triosephosphate isomerase
MTTARPLILGNWKMHRTPSETAAFLADLLPRIAGVEGREIAVAPPFTSLPAARQALQGGPVALAAQDLFWEDQGAYTGAISPEMLQDLGVRYVIVGHSERRRHFGETDHMVQMKVQAALRADLAPVVCVGEQEAARLSDRAAAVVRGQVLRALEGIVPGELRNVVLAYEPVWAIGTGRTATPADIAEMHAVIRGELESVFGPAGAAPRILYGGSVTPATIDAIMAAPGVKGVLVGGASLKAADFTRIAAYRAP